MTRTRHIIPPLGKQLLAWANAIPRHLTAIRELAVERKNKEPRLDAYIAEYDAKATNPSKSTDTDGEVKDK